MTELYRIEIPEFITHIELSKKRRAKKDENGKITNPRSAGTPKLKKINGQDLWVTIDHNLRSKMGRELKKYMYENAVRHLDEFPLDSYPIGIDMEFHLPVGPYDIDNLQVWYRKCFHDALAGSVDYKPYMINGKKTYVPNVEDYPAKIIDDSVEFIREANTKIVFVDTIEERKLIIKINKL